MEKFQIMISVNAFYVDNQRVVIAISYFVVFVIGIYIARPVPTVDIVKLYATSKQYQTDKLAINNFKTMYEKNLRKYVGSTVSLLEIGLGCGMSTKPGASAYLWRNYLGQQANIHFIENDKKCAEKWYRTHGQKVKDCKKSANQ